MVLHLSTSWCVKPQRQPEDGVLYGTPFPDSEMEQEGEVQAIQGADAAIETTSGWDDGSVSRQLCKHKDLSSYPRTHVKKEDVVLCVYKPSTPMAAGRQRQKIPGSSQLRYPRKCNRKQETLP